MKETEISKKLDAILTAYFYYILTKSVFDFKAYARLSEIIIPNHENMEINFSGGIVNFSVVLSLKTTPVFAFAIGLLFFKSVIL